jgi:hypothetical protein
LPLRYSFNFSGKWPVTCIGKLRNAHKLLAGEPHLGNQVIVKSDNVKTELKEVESEDMDMFYLSQDMSSDRLLRTRQ